MPSKKNLDALAAAHDKKVIVPTRIRQALEKLKASGEDWAYELDFIKLATPPIAGLDVARYRDGFVEFWRDMPSTNGKSSAKRVWFASSSLAKKWDERLNG